jgi:hypothetical protein
MIADEWSATQKLVDPFAGYPSLVAQHLAIHAALDRRATRKLGGAAKLPVNLPAEVLCARAGKESKARHGPSPVPDGVFSK